MTIDPLSVQVTGREIYDGVIRLTGRVDVLIVQQTELSKDIIDTNARIKELENRVRTLESLRWPLPTLTILISLAALALVLLQTFK